MSLIVGEEGGRGCTSDACSSPNPIGSDSRSSFAAASLAAALGSEKAAIAARARASSPGPSVKKSSAFVGAKSSSSADSGTGSSPLRARVVRWEGGGSETR